MSMATLTFDLSDPIQKKEHDDAVNAKNYKAAFMEVIIQARAHADVDGNVPITKLIRECGIIAANRNAHEVFLRAKDCPIE